ncbi:uncharacterized protein LOC144121944 isoform X1 [Amblyomma americanum]
MSVAAYAFFYKDFNCINPVVDKLCGCSASGTMSLGLHIIGAVYAGHVHQGSWRDRADPCGAMKLLSKTDGNCSRSARETREVFKSYFCNEGQVSWQWKLVSRP